MHALRPDRLFKNGFEIVELDGRHQKLKLLEGVDGITR